MFLSTGINDSNTVVGKAAIPLINAAFHAAKYDAQGGIVPAGAGENALGLFIANTPQNVGAGDDVNIQIKDIGLWVTGAAVLAGAELASNAGGQAITAAAGAFILAIALESAAAPGTIIKVQVIKAGYKNGGVVAPLTLAGLTDVGIAAIQDGEAIVYDAAAQKYVNKALELEDLENVTIANPADGEVMAYDVGTTSWKNTAAKLEDLSDVEIAAPVDGDAIKYDGADSKWKNKQ